MTGMRLLYFYKHAIACTMLWWKVEKPFCSSKWNKINSFCKLSKKNFIAGCGSDCLVKISLRTRSKVIFGSVYELNSEFVGYKFTFHDSRMHIN